MFWNRLNYITRTPVASEQKDRKSKALLKQWDEPGRWILGWDGLGQIIRVIHIRFWIEMALDRYWMLLNAAARIFTGATGVRVLIVTFDSSVMGRSFVLNR